jgi:hypothetical protein
MDDRAFPSATELSNDIRDRHITPRDRETRTVVGYYNGAWTTDRRRALTLRWREAAEAHAARMRDRCPRNAELITVEEIAAGDYHSTTSSGLFLCR